MSSEEYINQVNRLIDLQNIYLQIFLTMIALILGFIGIIQWRLNTKQLEQLKEQTKQETINEIEESLEVSSLADFKLELEREREKEREKVEEQFNYLSYNQFDFELEKLSNEDTIPLWHLTYLLDIHKSNILLSINNFNYYVLRLESLISVAYAHKKIDINSPHIAKIVLKLSEFEKTFNEKSEKLENFKNIISYYQKN